MAVIRWSRLQYAGIGWNRLTLAKWLKYAGIGRKMLEQAEIGLNRLD